MRPETRKAPGLQPDALQETTDIKSVRQGGRGVKPRAHRGAFPDRSFRALQRLGSAAFEVFLDVDGIPISRWGR